MQKHQYLPIIFETADQIDRLIGHLRAHYVNVEFTDDFGSIKKGEKFRSLEICYGESWQTFPKMNIFCSIDDDNAKIVDFEITQIKAI